MYSESINYNSYESNETTYENSIRNKYFSNRNCLINLLDFLNQEVIIVPSSYFSYVEGSTHIGEDLYLMLDFDNKELCDKVFKVLDGIDNENGYHICILDNYITIIAQNMRCIFTNKDMEHGSIIGSIFWVENYGEILEKYKSKNLKLISKAIVNPNILKAMSYDENIKSECLDEQFFSELVIYQPEVIFEYTIDSFRENECLDIYDKLAKMSLNGLVDRYLPYYERCKGYGISYDEEGSSRKLCKCGGLRALCYLD